MSLTSVLGLLGGIGLFLYGMNLLSSYLQKVAGASMASILERLTSNPVKGVALGAIVTGVIQSSAATSVMVIGFINAGIMKLTQAVPVVMGANIGTTVTAQILRLGDISNDNIVMLMLKPSSFAPICIIIAAVIILLSKRKKRQDAAHILMGLGILFIGMTLMESNLAPLKSSESFQQLFYMFKNPLLGILLGLLVTAILQSSSASVGVLQALSSTGTITFSMTAPIVMGMNVGKCITVIIASIGTNKKAKRAVLIDVMTNVFGVILFFAVIYGYQTLVGFSFWDDTINRGGIANFHSLFNLVTTCAMLPLYHKLIALSGKIIKENESTKMEKLTILDDIFLDNPSLALDQCSKIIVEMGSTVKENYDLACELLLDFDEKKMSKLEENENFLDRTETVLGDYLQKITSKDITDRDSKWATEIIHTVGDLERIGDYCVNVAEVGEYNRDQNLSFTEECQNELHYIRDAVAEIIQTTMDSYTYNNLQLASRIEPLEETVDCLVEILKSKHVERLKIGTCNTQSGISFLEVLTNVERISDHCSNIGIHVIQRIRNVELNTHSLMHEIHTGSQSFESLFEEYKQKYLDPIK